MRSRYLLLADTSLWEEGAEVHPTTLKDIRLVREPLRVTDGQLAETLDRLARAVERDDRAAIVEAIRLCIPTADASLAATVLGPRPVAVPSAAGGAAH